MVNTPFYVKIFLVFFIIQGKSKKAQREKMEARKREVGGRGEESGRRAGRFYQQPRHQMQIGKSREKCH